jgi:hypothetical protein
MSVALSILLIALSVEGLVTFAVGFVVPYPNPNKTHRLVLQAQWPHHQHLRRADARHRRTHPAPGRLVPRQPT